MRQILIPGADLDNLGLAAEIATFISDVDGSILSTWPELPTAETGDILPNGVWAITAQSSPGVNIASIDVYDADNTLIASIPIFSPPTTWHEFSPIRSDGVQFYFLACPKSSGSGTIAYLYTISDAGVVGGTSWALPADANKGAAGMAPARDGSRVYYGKNKGSQHTLSNAVGVMRLSDSVQLSDLVPGGTGITIGRDILTTADDDILVLRHQTIASGGTSLWEVRRYDMAGSLLFTYFLESGAATGDAIELGTDPGDDSVFWVRTYPTTSTSRFRRIQISDGTELTDFTVTTIDSGGAGATLIPKSCPFLIMGEPGSPGSPGSPVPPTGEVIGPLFWIEFARRRP